MPQTISRLRRRRLRAMRWLAHDLGQPLHALTLYLGALERRIGDEETKAILAKMEAAAAEISRSLDRLR